MNSLFILKGKVQDGKKRGIKMGFPTANFSADPSIPQGTYISQIEVKSRVYPSVTFIGTVETFDEKDFVAETYILDFSRDIYGEEVSVNVLKKLRDNKKFESEEALIEQMKKDEAGTRLFFSQSK